MHSHASGADRRTPAHDPNLPLPGVRVSAERVLPFELATLALAPTSSHVRFAARGRDAAALGRLGEPAFAVECDALAAASHLVIAGAQVVDARVTSLGIVRRLRVRDAVLVERIFVPPALAAAVVEWSLEDSGGRSLPGRLAWRVDVGRDTSAGDASLRWHADDRALVACAGDDAVAFALSRDAGLQHAVRMPYCAAIIELDGAPLRLIVAGSRSGLDAALATLAACIDAEPLVRARAAALRRSSRERLSLITPDAAIGTAFDWACLRLADRVHDVGLRPPSSADGSAKPVANRRDGTAIQARPMACLWTGLAALAIGDTAVADAALLRLAAPWEPGPGPGLGVLRALPGSPDAPVHEGAQSTVEAACFLILTAWHARWTADATSLVARLSAARRAAALLDAPDAANTDAANTDLADIALAGIAHAAETIEPRFAAEVAGMRARRGAVPRDGVDQDDRLWRHLVSRGDGVGFSDADLDVRNENGLRAWAALLDGRTDAGTAEWPARLLQPIEAGNALWDADMGGDRADSPRNAAAGPPACPSALACAVLAFMHGIMGASPDAARHRLRLRLHLPRSWNRWSVRNLRMGDARIEVAVERTTGEITVRAAQTEGAVPVRLVLEALTPKRQIGAIRVDGHDAQLEVRRFGDGLIVPVQVDLDNERSLAVRLAPGGR